MSRVFCAHCGNKTLKKVSVTVSDDGALHMHFSRNPKVLNPRGLRVSGASPSPLPTPESKRTERTKENSLVISARSGVESLGPRYQDGAGRMYTCHLLRSDRSFGQ